jgi:hydroxypyruvate isomerase
MLKLSANISLLYPERDFLARPEAAAHSGFQAVEVMYPYDYRADALAAALRRHGLELSVLNAPAGDYAAGQRGMACIPGVQDDFRASIEEAIGYAQVTACRNVHVLTGNRPANVDDADCERVLRENLLHAARRFAESGLVLLLEPLSREVLPRYSVTTVEQAAYWHGELRRAGFENVALQVDLYHTQMEEGNLATVLQRHRDAIRYVQLAGVPGRHEPTVGEVNYRYLLELLESWKFDGWVGCEYIPQGDTDQGLQWARDWGFLKSPATGGHAPASNAESRP